LDEDEDEGGSGKPVDAGGSPAFAFEDEADGPLALADCADCPPFDASAGRLAGRSSASTFCAGFGSAPAGSSAAFAIEHAITNTVARANFRRNPTYALLLIETIKTRLK
jgi:hypothetical protein